MSIQYRVVFSKGDEVVDGPDDASLVISVPAVDAHLDPTVAFMLGRLKGVGPTGTLFAVLADGSAAAMISQLASRP